MYELQAAAVRVWAFFRKEVVEIIRQPRLVVSLVLAPFLILALFGAGYRQTVQPLKTMFVATDEESFRSSIEPRLSELGGAIVYEGVTGDRSDAIIRLGEGSIDVMVVVPDHPDRAVRDNQRAIFEVVHDKLDPYEQATITLITDAAVDAVNRSILEGLVAEGQERAEGSDLGVARESATALRMAMEVGDAALAAHRRDDLDRRLAEAQSSSAASETLFASLRESFGEEADMVTPASLREDVAGLDLTTGDTEVVRRIENDLVMLEEASEELRSIDPEILVSPLGADSDLIGSVELGVTDFYAPGVIALLLQHLSVTFAGLSLVRERALGTTELFQVAPLGPSQLLLGKYLGYSAVAGLVSVLLSGLMFLGFGVPFVGSIGAYSLVLTLLVIASLGVGFVISSLVSTDTQAVNASMIVLLLSIFFSGFFLSTDRLIPEVRLVSWALPITHALDSLRDVLFRGAPVDSRTIIALGGGSLGLFAASSFLTRRRLSAQ